MELEKKSAVVEGESKHSWGSVCELWKLEAIDTFSKKHLLGVFESEEEAKKALQDWNVEYEKACADMGIERRMRKTTRPRSLQRRLRRWRSHARLRRRGKQRRGERPRSRPRG